MDQIDENCSRNFENLSHLLVILALKKGGKLPDSEELNRMMLEISAGWKYGDPRSKVPKRKDIKKSWKRLKKQMDEIKAEGGIVEMINEF